MSTLISVTDTTGTTLTLRVPDIEDLALTPEDLEHVAYILDDALDEMELATGEPRKDCAGFLAGELVRRHHDEAAYRREAERRGVLAL